MKKTVITSLLILVAFIANAQYSTYGTSQQRRQQETVETKKSGFDSRKLTFGGGFGLQFGDYTVINIAPQVGYDFSKYVNAGVGLNYTHYNESYTYFDRMKETSNYFGINVYGKLYPVPYIVLMVQPEANRMWQSVKNKRTGEKWTEEKFVPVVIVGGGVRLGPITAMIQYDVVQDNRSPYGDNIFYSVGYSFNF